MFQANLSVGLLTTNGQTISAAVTATSGVDTNLANNTTTVVFNVGSCAGVAWLDLNKDRVFNSAEPPLSGLLVKVFKGAGTSPVKTAVTSSTGSYVVLGLSLEMTTR